MQALGSGFAGAHRTGKTTLAKLMAEKNNAPFIQSSMSKLATEMGIHIGLSMPFSVRREFQDAALKMFEESYEKEGRGRLFFTDRCPLDLAAYVMTAWHPIIASDEDAEWCDDYVKRCIAATNKWFFQINVLQPANIPYVEEEQKGENIPFYRESLNATIMGLAWMDEVIPAINIIPREITDLKERSEQVGEHYSEHITEYAAILRSHFPLQ